MELILWRHAEAEDGFPDMARELTNKGHRQAKQMAAWLKPRLPQGTRILVSPARRTQQTVAALGLDFNTVDALSPGASVETILTAADWPDAKHAALIVGHQPTLGAVAARLLDSNIWSLSTRKGALWWFTARRGEVVLKAMLPPELLEE
ncbi:MAG: histidine phosphatase family protein [Methylobacillus sp.]|jgi:phosphohistidine phosphatase|nr:histidine phosphatase family protein [Methylobacillus sp.]